MELQKTILNFPIHWSQVLVENEDVISAAPTGDAPATSEWSTYIYIAY